MKKSYIVPKIEASEIDLECITCGSPEKEKTPESNTEQGTTNREF